MFLRDITVKELKSELESAEAAEADAEKNLKEAEKDATANRLTLSNIEKNRVKLAGALDSMQPETIKTQEEVRMDEE